jgi:DNA-binding LacI/PurR family transcriptional regulator
MDDQKPTIMDVAKAAGVSVATVSRYFTKRGQVNEETAEAISNAVHTTGYEYMRRKSIPLNKNKNVMIICGDISSQVYVQYIRGIEHTLGHVRYKPLIVDSQYENKREEEYLQYAIDQHFYGVIMLNVIESKNMINLIKSCSIPGYFFKQIY